MVSKAYFTPGPSELYPSVKAHLATALDNKIGTISHRSKQFQEIYSETCSNLSALLKLPANYEILFLSSATEIWERIIENCVENTTFHCVNGSFSKRFYDFSLELGKTATKAEAAFGKGFYPEEFSIPSGTEAICLTQNETSSGVAMPVSDINKIREKNKEALLFVDSVSSLPHPDFDFGKIDSTFVSVQKCFGLPAGLGVWFLNDRCIGKAKALQEKGIRLGTYHTIPSMLDKAKVNQTPETPNVLSIYLLGKVVGDMLEKGIDTIRKETAYKASLLYNYFEASANFNPLVEDKNHQSATTIVAKTAIASPEINKALDKFNMQVGTGYGAHKESQIRVANFPAHTVESMEKLVATMKTLW